MLSVVPARQRDLSDDNRVNLDEPRIEYSSEGVLESSFYKDEYSVNAEIDVFYRDFFEQKAPAEIPLSVFSQNLSPLQAAVKYLKDEKGLGFSEIARLLNRDPRTIWATHDSVRDTRLVVDENRGIRIPVSVLADRSLSTLESLVEHLLGLGKSLKEAAFLLGKNYQTIWTVKQRVAEKRKASGAVTNNVKGDAHE